MAAIFHAAITFLFSDDNRLYLNEKRNNNNLSTTS